MFGDCFGEYSYCEFNIDYTLASGSGSVMMFAGNLNTPILGLSRL